MEEVMDFSRRFERAFVELVGRRLEKQGWKKGRVCRQSLAGRGSAFRRCSLVFRMQGGKKW